MVCLSSQGTTYSVSRRNTSQRGSDARPLRLPPRACSHMPVRRRNLHVELLLSVSRNPTTHPIDINCCFTSRGRVSSPVMRGHTAGLRVSTQTGRSIVCYRLDQSLAGQSLERSCLAIVHSGGVYFVKLTSRSRRNIREKIPNICKHRVFTCQYQGAKSFLDARVIHHRHPNIVH